MLVIIDEKKKSIQKTYNTGDSLIITDPTTNLALRSLTMGERTGPRILYELWSYVINSEHSIGYETRDEGDVHQRQWIFG
jgi:hypothetical protein